MYFTLLFDQYPEGPTLSFDLVYHSCPEWFQHGESLVVPNRRSPHYEIGHLKHLLDKAEIELENLNSNRVGIVCHEMGHGTNEYLELLLEDMKIEGLDPHILHNH